MRTIFVAVLLVFLFTSCATEPKIDWTARVGHYTYNDAVLELGPPDKVARLDNGMVVANWITRRGYSYVSTGAVAYGYYPGVVAMPGYTQGYQPAAYLRLTFGAGGKLATWKKYVQ